MTNSKLYKSMPESQMLSPLSVGEYKFVYEKLRYKKTFSYIDEKNNINLVADCGNDDMLTILRAKKSVYIDKHSLGAIVQVKLIEYGISFDFVYDVYNDEDLSLINAMVNSNNGIIINFVTKDKGKISKGFHINFNLEEGLKERLNYIKSSTYNFQYPRIKKEQLKGFMAKTLEYEFHKNIVGDIIEVCDRLSKWKSLDDFQIYVVNEENLTIYIVGECKNFNFIKSELNNNYKFVSEGEGSIKGIPLVKYNKGYLYFYNYGN